MASHHHQSNSNSHSGEHAQEEYVFITMKPEKEAPLCDDSILNCASSPASPAGVSCQKTTTSKKPGSPPVSKKPSPSKLSSWMTSNIPEIPIPFLKRTRKKADAGTAGVNATRKRKRADETLYHTLSIDQVKEKFGTCLESGLTASQAASILQQKGRNELKGQEGPSWISVLGKQFLNGLTLILLIALGVSAGLQQWIEVGVIAFIVASNTIIGFHQEYKAESTMASLRSLSAPKALLLRDGTVQEVAAAEIVVGDVIVLKQGNVVPADLRLFKSKNLHIDESLLTGESEPVEKTIQPIEDGSVGLGDRKNLAFMSTPVTKGSGRGIVIATGMNSEVGEIAQKIAESDKGTSTPLTRRLDKMAYILFAMALVLALVVLAVNSFDFSTEVVLYAVSIAIAMIPEGLVAVVTITMALSVRKMTNLKALVRRLNTLEALGAVTDICSDKTGTLTQARMVASELWVLPGKQFNVSGIGFETQGTICEVAANDQEEPVSSDRLETPLKEAMLVCALCNNAIVNVSSEKAGSESFTTTNDVINEPVVLGEPTEIALQILAHKVHMSKEALLRQGWSSVEEYAFDSSIKRMTSIYSAPVSEEPHSQSFVALTKGAPERVLDLCSKAFVGKTLEPIDDEMRRQFATQNEKMASHGLRVIALAMRTEAVFGAGMRREEVEREMSFLGFVGIYDPPRVETKAAVQTCIDAGIVVHMVTGDHPATAYAIAKQVSILPNEEMENGLSSPSPSSTITARELDQMTDEEIDAMPELPRVIARCSPDTKVKLIQALHRRNRFVAMTGDGVNDAPALKFADVGVAMGKNGSDVAREASDMILTDDNFSTIVEAIKEGRRIFLNIAKFISHLMAGNVAEVIALILGLTIMDASSRSVYILSPIQILWINMVTSSPPAMALGVEPAPRKVMQRPPNTAGLFTVEFLVDTMVYGVVMGAITLLSFVFSLYVFKGGDIGVNCNTFGDESVGCSAVYESRSVPFVLLSVMLLFHAFNLKDKRKPIWRINFLNNKVLLAAVAIGTAVSIPVIYIPYINHHVFVCDPITWEWAIVGVGLASFIVLGELYKAAKRAWWPEHKEVAISSIVKKGTHKVKRKFKKNKNNSKTTPNEGQSDSEIDLEAQESESEEQEEDEEEQEGGSSAIKSISKR